jgi:Cd2+/Zn2+-exporting ATPase
MGVVNGKEVYVGNERLFERLGLLAGLPEETQRNVEAWKQLGGTIGFMSTEGHGIVCAYCAADGVRQESPSVVAHLKKLGIAITMLTGDNEEAALAVGRQVGLSPDEIQSKLLPEEKLDYLKVLSTGEEASSLLRLRKNRHVVLFCGDGVNDAPALAAADVGVAIGAGAALAMETADVTLLDSNLEKLEYCMQVGRRVIRKIWENIIFSITVKLIVLVFALAGKTHLWAAIATDVGAMILVTLNSMTLLPRSSSTKPDVSLECLSDGSQEKGGCTPTQEKGGCCDEGCCAPPQAKGGCCDEGCCAPTQEKGGCCDEGCCAPPQEEDEKAFHKMKINT